MRLWHDDIIRFQQKALTGRGMSTRTVSNRHNSVKAFLRYCGCDTKELPKAPKYDKTMPEIYTDRELNALFDAVTSPRESLLSSASAPNRSERTGSNGPRVG